MNSKGGKVNRAKVKSALSSAFEAAAIPPASSSSSSKIDSKRPKKKEIKAQTNQPSAAGPTGVEEKSNKKKRVAGDTQSSSGWKRVKLSEEMAFGEAGFYMLEELTFDPSMESSTYASLLKAIPKNPEPLEEEPIVDTLDSDIDDGSDEEVDNSSSKKKDKTNSQNKAAAAQKENKASQEKKVNNLQAKKTSAKVDKPQNATQAMSSVGKESISEVKANGMDVDEQNDLKETLETTERDSKMKVSEEDGEDVIADSDGDDEEEEKPQTKKKHVFVSQDDMELVDLPAWMSVYPLHKALLNSLKEMGFEQPTAIQTAVMPVALGKRWDVIGASQTGSGKTLAFGLPILHQILELQEKAHRLDQPMDSTLKALILSPTRELAIQIVDHLEKCVGTHAYIKIAPVIGGISVTKQMRYLRKRPDIIVATPGRLWELISSGLVAESGNSLADLRWLVFDEADKMVEFGRFTELSNILRTVYDSRKRQYAEQQKSQGISRLESYNDDGDDEDENSQRKLHIRAGSKGHNANANSKDESHQNGQKKAKKSLQQSGIKPLQTFIFSATMSIGEDARKNLKKVKKANPKQAMMKKRQKHANVEPEALNSEQMFEKLMEQIDFQREVELVDITTSTHQVSTLEEAKIFCLHDEKDYYLYYFLTRYEGKSIIFVNAISNIKRLLPLMVILRIPAFGMHAHMEQHHRLKNLEKFKASKHAVLITTDVLARGVDIPQVDHVIHYSIPTSAENFVHRSGRTARAFATGLCIHIVDPEDKRHYSSIMHTLGREEVPDFPVDMAYYTAAKKRVKLAAELDSLSHETQKKSAESQWLSKKAKELDAEIPDDLLSSDDEATIKQKAYAASKRKIRYKVVKEELRELLTKPMVARGTSLSYVTKSMGANQLFQTNSPSFQSPPEEGAESASSEKKSEKVPSSFVASSSAFADVVKTKGSKLASHSSIMLEKVKEKRKRRLEAKQGLVGPNKRR